jgi:hypothetical protein
MIYLDGVWHFYSGIGDACVAPRKETEGVLRPGELVRRPVRTAGRALLWMKIGKSRCKDMFTTTKLHSLWTFHAVMYS